MLGGRLRAVLISDGESAACRHSKSVPAVECCRLLDPHCHLRVVELILRYVALRALAALRVLAWGEVVEEGPVGFAGIERDSDAVVVEVGGPE